MSSVRVFYVDPMSYHNLAIYDYELLIHMDQDIECVFFANQKIQLQIPEITIRKIYRYSNKRGAVKGISYLRSQLELLRHIKKHKPDLVHFQWFKQPLIDYFILRRMREYAGIIYTSHDAFTHDIEEKYKTVFEKILDLVDAVIVHTDSSKKSLANVINQDKIYKIKHGLLNLSNYSQDTINTDEYKKHMGLEGSIIFSALGTMDQYKGTDLLLDAWESSAVLSQSNKVKLLIAGKNKLGLKADDIKAENIILIDRFIPDEEFSTMLSISDLVLMPYRRISQSGLLLSALAAQKKILVSRAGDLAEPFTAGNIGWILEETNTSALRDLLERIVLDETDKLLEPVDQNTWDCIKNCYKWDHIGLETSRLYRSCAGKRSFEKKKTYEQN